MSNPHAAQLESSKRVLCAVMRTHSAKQWFNDPVDPISLNLPDYFDVIKEPIDLGTIRKRLEEGHKCEWSSSSFYQNAKDVFDDVSRVWSNCFAYNKTPQDAPVREACEKTMQIFEKKWKEAGLLEYHVSNEIDIPEAFSIRKESVELPVRLLDGFYIASVDDPNRFVPLDQITSENAAIVQAIGTLLLPTQSNAIPSNSGSSFSVILHPLTDWCFQYGDFPGIWIVTQRAWYKLLNPADAYLPYVSGTIQRFMTTLSLLNFDEGRSLIPSGKSTFSNGNCSDSLSIPDEIVEMLMEDESIREGTLKLMRKRSRSPSREKEGSADEDTDVQIGHSGASSCSQESEISRGSQKAKANLHPQRSLRSTSEKLVISSKEKTKESGSVSKRSSRKKPHLQDLAAPVASAPMSDVDEDDPLFDPSSDADVVMKEDEDEDYVHGGGRRRNKRVGESEAQRMKRERKTLEQMKRDKEADLARGPPPTVMADFRIPQELIGIALSVWDFLMTFHIPLEIPPMPFWRFDAALCPLHYQLDRSELRQYVAKHPNRSVQDPEAAASALVLQDVHIALWRVLQGKNALAKDTPCQASVTNPLNQSHWTQTIALFLLKPSPDIDQETKGIAAFLHGHEYLDLSVDSKLKILQTLVNLVISTDVFRDSVNGSIERLTMQKTQSYQEKPLNVDILEATDLTLESKAQILSSERWANWFLAHRVSVLSDIGQDFRGTHYWILGGSAGCFRIYVEYRPLYEESLNENGRSSRSRGRTKSDGTVFWGWYEGESIAQLIAWIEDGDLEFEKTLLETLHHIPKAIRLERNRSHSESPTLNIINVGYHKMDETALEAFRIDSYAEIRYPLLRGEGEISEMPQDVHPTARIGACTRALLSAIPFWERDANVVTKIAQSLDHIVNHQDAAALSKEVCAIMELLFTQHVVKEEWKALKTEWERSLSGCHSLHGIIAHLTVCQSFLKPLGYSVHHPAFDVMVHQAKCPLYFPKPGEDIVVLRTGCLAHLEHSIDIAKQIISTANIPCLKKSTHPKLLSMAKQRAEELPPVQQFKVSCIAYRTPYSEPPPEGTKLAEDHAIPLQACMWLLLSASTSSSSVTTIVLPLHVDNLLPDFIVKVSAFEQSKKTHWKVGDRFKMYFGGKGSARSASGYYKGTISGVKQAVLGEAYDPWESLTVEWDNDNTGASMKVSPWEIEVDPEEQRKMEEARNRQPDARARQTRTLQRNEIFADMLDGEDAQSGGDPDYDPLSDVDGGKSSQRTRRRGSAIQELVYYDPKNPAGPVPPEIMALVPDRHEFAVLIHNFMQRIKGKFKCPVFSGKDLDLYKVFHEVQQRGGYDVVTNLKLWKDVCRTLNVNLKGQTSASYNMRLNYEKCLLDFEHYLLSGRYNQDLQNGTAPSRTIYESFPHKLRGFEMQAVLEKGGGTETEQMMTRGARRSQNLSLMQLLTEGASQSDSNFQNSVPKISQKPSDFERVVPPILHLSTESQNSSINDGYSSVPTVAQGSISEFDFLKCDNKRDPVEIQPGESIGMALDRMGWALIGSQIWRRWPSHGKWCKVDVVDYNRETNEHCLRTTYSASPEETEWVELRELEGEDISQHDPTFQFTDTSFRRTIKQSPPVQKTPVKPSSLQHVTEREELSSLLAETPRALQRLRATPLLDNVPVSSASSSGIESMSWIQRMMNSGISSEFFTQVVDQSSLKHSFPTLSSGNAESFTSQDPTFESLRSRPFESLSTEEKTLTELGHQQHALEDDTEKMDSSKDPSGSGSQKD